MTYTANHCTALISYINSVPVSKAELQIINSEFEAVHRRALERIGGPGPYYSPNQKMRALEEAARMFFVEIFPERLGLGSLLSQVRLSDFATKKRSRKVTEQILEQIVAPGSRHILISDPANDL